MYTACTHPAVKEQVVDEFCDACAKLRVVIATIVFGMGLDCPDVRRVIHWGPSEDIEMYLQETGRVGQNGMPSTCSYCLQYSWGKTCTSFHERVCLGLKQRGVQTNDASKRL